MQLYKHAAIKSGHPFRGAVKDAADGDVRVVQGKDIDPLKGILWTEVARTSINSRNEPVWLRKDDILFAARGARNYAVRIQDVPAQSLCSPQFYIIRVEVPHVLMPEFLVWQLNQDICQQHFDLNRTGTTVGNIKRQALASAPITVPDIETQLKITKLANAVDREKTFLTSLIKNRETQIRAVAKDILAGDNIKGRFQ